MRCAVPLCHRTGGLAKGFGAANSFMDRWAPLRDDARRQGSTGIRERGPMDREFDYLRLVYLLAFLILVSPALYMILRDKRRAVRNLVIWLVIAAAVTAGYWLFN